MRKIRARTLAKYQGIDWSQQDVVIAEQYGISRERARQLRTVFNAPKSGKHRLMRREKRERLGQRNLDWSRSNEELATEYKCSPSTIYRWRKEAHEQAG